MVVLGRPGHHNAEPFFGGYACTVVGFAVTDKTCDTIRIIRARLRRKRRLAQKSNGCGGLNDHMRKVQRQVLEWI